MKIFKQHPNLERFFETSDGQKFYTENSASIHAKTLENKKVMEVKRPDGTDEVKKSLSKMNFSELKAELVILNDSRTPKSKAEAIEWINDNEADIKGGESKEVKGAPVNENTEESDKNPKTEE